MFRRVSAAVLLSLGFVFAPFGACLAEPADWQGRVFEDADADGVRDPGEAGRSGVAVSNGRDVVRTGPDGRYVLPARAEGFVTLTCPADAKCPVWFSRVDEDGASDRVSDRDFGLVAAADADDFFFVHLSDAHVYERVEDMAGLLPGGSLPWYVPRVVAGWFLLRGLDRAYPQLEREEIVAGLRAVVSRHRDVTDAWDETVMIDYVELALDPATGIVAPAEAIRRSFDEIAALSPALVINTGDMVLEGNDGEPEAIERWYDYYQQVVAASGLEIHETIGNNELAGTGNDDFPPSDPRYGKAMYRRSFGPTHYSFDRGPFHFVAVDTHKPLFDVTDPAASEEWTFYEMSDEVQHWLDADLAQARAAGRRLVVLNHEPFFYDPAWQFDEPTPADDAGLFAKHGVAYELSGHIHRNGFRDAPSGGGVTHITTGALSGFRWSLPLSIDSRGYRVLYAHDGSLYSAWKDTGEPLLGFVDPRGDASIHPASTHASAPDALHGRVEIVAVGVDIDHPYKSLALWLDGEPLESERWGDYFVHAHFDAARLVDAARLAGAGRLELRAVSGDGSERSVPLEVSRRE